MYKSISVDVDIDLDEVISEMDNDDLIDELAKRIKGKSITSDELKKLNICLNGGAVNEKLSLSDVMLFEAIEEAKKSKPYYEIIDCLKK